LEHIPNWLNKSPASICAIIIPLPVRSAAGLEKRPKWRSLVEKKRRIWGKWREVIQKFGCDMISCIDDRVSPDISF
jgi:hypothetical protein